MRRENKYKNLNFVANFKTFILVDEMFESFGQLNMMSDITLKTGNTVAS